MSGAIRPLTSANSGLLVDRGTPPCIAPQCGQVPRRVGGLRSLGVCRLQLRGPGVQRGQLLFAEGNLLAEVCRGRVVVDAEQHRDSLAVAVTSNRSQVVTAGSTSFDRVTCAAASESVVMYRIPGRPGAAIGLLPDRRFADAALNHVRKRVWPEMENEVSCGRSCSSRRRCVRRRLR